MSLAIPGLLYLLLRSSPNVVFFYVVFYYIRFAALEITLLSSGMFDNSVRYKLLYGKVHISMLSTVFQSLLKKSRLVALFQSCGSLLGVAYSILAVYNLFSNSSSLGSVAFACLVLSIALDAATTVAILFFLPKRYSSCCGQRAEEHYQRVYMLPTFLFTLALRVWDAADHSADNWWMKSEQSLVGTEALAILYAVVLSCKRFSYHFLYCTPSSCMSSYTLVWDYIHTSSRSDIRACPERVWDVR